MSDRHDTLDRHGHATAAKVATSSPGRAWLAAGAPRRDPVVRPDGLTAEAPLQRVTR